MVWLSPRSHMAAMLARGLVLFGLVSYSPGRRPTRGVAFVAAIRRVMSPLVPNEWKEVMAEPIPAQKAPFKVELQAGRRYAWCACGRSSKQPFCDGTHAEYGLEPVIFTAEETKEVFLCGCKHSGGKPYCDGTHATF